MFVIEADGSQSIGARAEELAARSRAAVFRRTSHLFVGLLVIQWVAAVALAAWVSPLTWSGAESRTHPHVWIATVLGLAIISLPVWLGLTRPEAALTRHVIAVGQMLSGSLLIHLTGGRLETHFHVFGSLAFLAFYRDWRVLITASAVAAADHFVRGLVWPESVYGTTAGVTWRWLEHAGWVVFLDVFLIYSCVRGGRDLRQTAHREAALEAARADVEKQVEERTQDLRESEARVRAVIEQASDAIFVHGPGGVVADANPRACESLGYSRDELIGLPITSLDPDATPDQMGWIGEQIRTRGHAGFETRHRRKDGTDFPVEVRVGRMEVHGGEMAMAVARDITERKRAEESLRESEERFRGAIEHAPIGMALVAPDGRFLRVNPALCRIVGYGDAELLARGFQEITHPDDLAPDLAQVARMLAGEIATYQMEKRYFHKDGRVVWVLLSASLVRDAAGKPLYFVSQIQDITARREAEAELRRTRGQLLDAIDSLDAGFVMYDAGERLVICNDKYREIYPAVAPLLAPGTPHEDIVRAGLRSGAFPCNGLTEDEVVAERLAAHRNPAGPTERRVGDRWLRVSTRRTRDGGVVSLRTDITALKRATEAAEAASRAKGEFLANMSHEIRTPMNGILGFTNLLLETDLTREQRESLSLVKTSADALLTVINDILDFSKIEAGKLDLDPVPFALRDEVGDTLKSIALRAHEKGLELTCDVRPDVPHVVVGDADRIRQVLTNLVGNAVKFTAEGEVVVCVERLAGAPDAATVTLRFSVRDTGIGIPPEKLGAIFDPFTQADGSTTRKYGGTGLGLTICSRLVELMGGRIWVESEPGKGSTFFFETTFGIARGSKARSVEGIPTSLVGVPVLVVDDNKTNRRVLEETLRQWMARPVCADSGPAALAELRRAAALGEPYPLVLLDVMMPEMDGFAVAEKIVAEQTQAPPAVLMLTSADAQGDAARCRKMGLAGYLVKPVKLSELLRAISHALSGDSRSRGTRDQPRGNAEVRPLRVLLAEDNPINQRVAIRMLEAAGQTVTIAGNGREAVAAAGRERFDLILMDVQMPEMDGFEATAAIRRAQAGSGHRTPIVAMTAHAMKGDRERCLAAGMDEYLSKPVDRNDLLRTLSWAAGCSTEEPPAPVDAQTPPPAPAFDRDAALGRLGGDEGLLAELATLFREEGPRAIRDITASLASADAAGVRRAAHGLKGAAGYVGGTLVAAAAMRVEELGAAGDLAPVPDALQALETEVNRLSAALAGG